MPDCLKCNEPFEASQFSAYLCRAHNDTETREKVIHRQLREFARCYVHTWAVIAIRRSGVKGSQGLFWVFEPVERNPCIFGVYVEKDCRPVPETLGGKYPYYQSREEFVSERDGDPSFSTVNPRRLSFKEQTHPLNRELDAFLNNINPRGTNSMIVFSTYYDYVEDVSHDIVRSDEFPLTVSKSRGSA